jgi:hypothetical protein
MKIIVWTQKVWDRWALRRKLRRYQRLYAA